MKEATPTLAGSKQNMSMTMPAVGQDTGNTYEEWEILDEHRHKVMSMEPLFRVDEHGHETDTQVRPVRNEKAPNFRKLRESIFVRPYEQRERDPTHDACIETLVNLLQSSKLKVWSATFNDEGVRDPFGQILFSQGKPDYYWWQDGGPCRMAAGPGAYIQPDICGRSTAVFFPSARQQNVIIEVINTHPPELDTFYALLNYSQYNHLVIFYYVAEGANGSQYSRFDFQDGTLVLRVAHYLLGGKVFANGEERKPWNDARAWYEHLRETYFGTPLRDKRP